MCRLHFYIFWPSNPGWIVSFHLRFAHSHTCHTALKLHLEDDPLDAELVQATLATEGIDCQVTLVDSRDEFVIEMEGSSFDLILAESALLADLDNAESFVTLFLGQLNTENRSLIFVDCGHGLVFLRRRDGTVEDLLPRGLPLGVPGDKNTQEGLLRFETGDTLVLYSDGLVDARPELKLDNQLLARQLAGAKSAQEMVERLVGLTAQHGPQPNDVTVLVAHCSA